MALSEADKKWLLANVGPEPTTTALLQRDTLDRPGDNPDNEDWKVKHVLEGTFRRSTWGHMAAHDGLLILRELAKQQGCDVDEQAIVNGVLAGLSNLTPENIADKLAEAFPPELAQQVVDEWGRRLSKGGEQQ